MRNGVNIPIPKKLYDRIKPYARDECEHPEKWVREVLADYLDLLEVYTPRGVRKMDCRSERK